MPNDIPNSTWNEVDASNTSPVPNGAPEGWFPSDVNNVYRMGMGATKRFWDHINVTETTGGTTTAYTLTYDVAPQQLWAGELFSFVVNATCGAAPTLNVNALGAKSLRRWNGSVWATLGAGDIVANQVLVAYYNSGDSGSYDIVSGFRESTFSGGTLTSTTTMSGAAFNEAAQVDVASATTCDIGAAAANYVRITGTTTITGLGTIGSGARRKVVFAGALTLTHNATSLILPTGANITTAAGDTAEFESEGSGNWRCTDYQRASGAALLPLQQYAQAYCTISGGVLTTQKQTGFTSIVRNSQGKFTCTMSTAMPDANYVVESTCATNTADGLNRYCGEDQTSARSTTVFRLYVNSDNGGAQDPTALNIRVYA